MKKQIVIKLLVLSMAFNVIFAKFTFADIIQNDYVIISFDEKDRRTAEDILGTFSKIVAEINREVGYYDVPVIQLILTHRKKEFDQYVTRGKVPESSVAMAIPSLSKIIVMNPKALPPHTQFYQLLTHEYLHIVLHSIAPDTYIPLWFEEGFVQYYTHEWSINREVQFVTEALKGNMLDLQSYSYHYPEHKNRVMVFYLQSYYNFRYLIKRFDMERFYEFIDRIHNGQDFESSFLSAFGISSNTFLDTARKSISSHSILAFLYSGLGLFWIIIPMLLLIAYIRKQRHRKRLEAIWEKGELSKLTDE